MTFRMLIGLAVGLAVLCMVPSAEACMTSGCECTVISECGTYCGPCPPPFIVCNVLETTTTQTLVEFIAHDKVRLTLEGYTTTQLSPLNECLTAVPQMDSVKGLTAVVNYDGRNQLPFEEVSFVPSEDAGIEAGLMAYEHGHADTNEPWLGFESRIVGEVADGVPNHFTLDLELRQGVSPFAFLKELEEHGTFVTGASGKQSDGHLYFRNFGDTEIFVEYPIPFAPKRQPVAPVPFDF